MLSAYAKQVQDSDMEVWGSEIKTRARRKIGEISSKIESKQGQKKLNITSSDTGQCFTKTEMLKNAGLTRSVANRCELVAFLWLNVIDIY